MLLRIIAILPIFSILLAPALGAGRTFPYKAYVTAEDVYVRSGPGKSYYPTDKLKMGQEVEVYRHDPGGWYAVRPPKGSFSWVSSRLLEIGKDGLATVTGDRAAARVGSRHGDVRDVVQVRLDRGELVEVLQSGRSAAGEQLQRWCKIAPPAGEFRWIHGKFVDPDFPVDGVRKTTGDHSPVVQHSAAKSGRIAAAPPVPLEPAAPVGSREGAFSAVQEGGHSVRSHAPLSRDPAHPTPRHVAVAASDRGPSERSERVSPAVAMRHISPEEFRAEVDDLEMRVSVMVLEEPTVWEFDDLADRAEGLLAEAETAVERGRARLLAGKITRLADIKRRYDAVASTRRRVELARASTTPHVRHAQEPLGPAAEREDRYDGMGRLTRVVSPKVGAPRYALVNQQGGVNCYVTPAPDVNLRAYEGKRIGVTGISGLMLEPRARHVAAKHVTLLDDRRLR